MKTKIYIPLLLASITLTFGCGADNSDAPQIAAVKGWVTLDGKPVKSAMVTFQPEKGRPSIGHTDFEGQFELNYIADKKGAIIGPHKVRISTHKVEEIVESDERHEVPEIIPAEYNARSHLTANVEKGINEINFELTSNKR